MKVLVTPPGTRSVGFDGDLPKQSETLIALHEILLRKTQWCNYIENVLELITTNSCNGEGGDSDESGQIMI
eukprot:1389595-Ditylum_brightwellii.AAC.1